MSVAKVMKMVKENDIKFVDFRFTDTRGKEQHVTVPVSAFIFINKERLNPARILAISSGTPNGLPR